MEIRVLTKEEESQMAEWLRSYKFCYRCSECDKLYGSDFLEENKLCPEHSNKNGVVK